MMSEIVGQGQEKSLRQIEVSDCESDAPMLQVGQNVSEAKVTDAAGAVLKESVPSGFRRV